MAATPHDGSGTSLTFPGFTGSITGITYSQTETAGGTADVIDISHLGQTTGSFVLSQARPLKGAAGSSETGKTVSVEFIGTGILAGGTTGTLAITGGISLTGVATVASSSLTLAVNDVVRGNAEFRVA